MSDPQFEETIDDKLLELVHGEPSSPNRIGLFLTLMTLLLVLILFGTITRFVSEETQKLEVEAQETATQTLSRHFERRLFIFSDQLQNAIKTDAVPVSCSIASTLFPSYSEFVEFTRVDAKNRVVWTCLTPSAFGTDPYEVGQTLKHPATLQNIHQAVDHATQSYSLPYQKTNGGVAYVDLAIPSGDGGAFVARIALTTLVRNLTGPSFDYKYKTRFLVNGKEFRLHESAKTPELTHNIRIVASLAPLPANVAIATTNTQTRSVYSHTLMMRFILGFTALLILAIFWILRYQYKQIKTESLLRAHVVVRQALSQSFVDGLAVTDTHGKILYVNAAFERMFGYNSRQLLGCMPPYAFCRDTSIFQFENPTSGETTKREFKALRQDGSYFDCLAEIAPLAPEQGKRFHAGRLITLRNVTQQNQAHKAMILAHERTLRVLDSMDAAVSVLTTQQPIPELVFVNRRYIDVFGSDAGAHLRLKHMLQETDPTNTSAEVFDHITQIWVALTLQKISWVDGSLVETLTIRNVTRRKINEELLAQQLKKAEQSSHLITMGEMASSLAHELNQPLAAVQNYASASLTMLESHKMTKEDLKTGLNKIINQTQRAAQIIKRIRGFAKRAEPSMTATSVSRIIDETMELAMLQSKKLGVPIVLDVQTENQTLVCDAVMIEQVLLNLLKNAMEATGAYSDKPVRMRVVVENTRIVFYVVDYGCGISEEVAKHVFDPFFTTKTSGMGIGLNICRSIVENHHGRLTFEANPQRGTIFKLSLPIAGVV